MTPASLDELLKEWEKEANCEVEATLKGFGGITLSAHKRILSLIAVVRRQNSDMRKIFECADCKYAIKISEASIDEAERMLNETK